MTHLDTPTWMLCGYNSFLFVMSFSLSVFWLFGQMHLQMLDLLPFDKYYIYNL